LLDRHLSRVLGSIFNESETAMLTAPIIGCVPSELNAPQTLDLLEQVDQLQLSSRRRNVGHE